MFGWLCSSMEYFHFIYQQKSLSETVSSSDLRISDKGKACKCRMCLCLRMWQPVLNKFSPAKDDEKDFTINQIKTAFFLVSDLFQVYSVLSFT